MAREWWKSKFSRYGRTSDVSGTYYQVVIALTLNSQGGNEFQGQPNPVIRSRAPALESLGMSDQCQTSAENSIGNGTEWSIFPLLDGRLKSYRMTFEDGNARVSSAGEVAA